MFTRDAQSIGNVAVPLDIMNASSHTLRYGWYSCGLYKNSLLSPGSHKNAAVANAMITYVTRWIDASVIVTHLPRGFVTLFEKSIL